MKPIGTKIPLQRQGTTTDIADATIYLFSPAASYVTGDVLVVDGAWWQVGGFLGDLYPSLVIHQNEDPQGKL